MFATPRRRPTTAVILIVALLATLPVAAHANAYDTYETPQYWANLDAHRDAIEWELVDEMNLARAAHGLGPLRVQADLRQLARDWSATQRAEGRQYHRPGRSSEIGEVVWAKKHGGVRIMHVGFMESPGHRAQILDPRYNEVGVGYVFDADDARWWVTVNFRRRTSGSAAEPARPAPRPVGREFGVAPASERVAGTDRIATALALSAPTAHADQVVLARADEFADALAGGPLAAAVGGPLLLTSGDHLDVRVADELERLGTSTVHLLGGTAALDETVEAQLVDAGLDVVRHAGINRYETAVAVALATVAAHGQELPWEVIVADGQVGWPDALSGSAMAASLRTPLLLVGHGRVPDVVDDVIRQWADQGSSGPWIAVVGGHAVISDAQVDQLDRANGDLSVRRYAGADRYETSTLVADLMPDANRSSHNSNYPTRDVWVATGRNWPDALAAGPAAAAAGAVLLLVDGADVRRSPTPVDGIADYLYRINKVVVVGGAGAVTAHAQAQLQTMVR